MELPAGESPAPLQSAFCAGMQAKSSCGMWPAHAEKKPNGFHDDACAPAPTINSMVRRATTTSHCYKYTRGTRCYKYTRGTVVSRHSAVAGRQGANVSDIFPTSKYSIASRDAQTPHYKPQAACGGGCTSAARSRSSRELVVTRELCDLRPSLFKNVFTPQGGTGVPATAPLFSVASVHTFCA